MRQVRAWCESGEVAVAFDCARGMQDGEQLEWGVLSEPVHHRRALPLACSSAIEPKRTSSLDSLERCKTNRRS